MKTYLGQNRSVRVKRSVAALAVMLTAGGGALAFLPASAHAAAASPGYVFQTLNNQADPTFNQLLGINSSGVISGYFGSGAAGHPNKGYLLDPPYQQSNYVNENFPSSQQTQVTGLNNKGDTVGFWVNTAGTNRGFVEWNGSFTSYTNPLTPKKAPSVNQLLGINNAGIAVGFYNDKNGNAHPYELNQATNVFTALHVPGHSVLATGINNTGEIVGIATTGMKVTSSWLLVGGHHLTSFQFPGGSNTQAFGINDKNQIVGSYLDGAGVQHGFLLADPTGPVSHWKTIDDPNGVGSTVVNGINKAGDLVGFYTDSSGNTDGFLATPAVTVTKNLTFMPMPSGSATFGTDGSGHLTVTPNMAGFTPGSAHTVQLVSNGSVVASFGTLTAGGTGQADTTLDSTYTGSVPSGSMLVVLNGNHGGPVGNEPIAQSAPLSGGSGPVTLTAVEVTSSGKSYGTPSGTASITYNPSAQTLTVTVNASGLTPGKHAAHVHFGSCQSQGAVAYMLMDYTANSQGKVVNETRTLPSITTPIPPSGWYLNLHQGNSNNILKNGVPTIHFRPLLCSNV